MDDIGNVVDFVVDVASSEIGNLLAVGRMFR